MISVNFFATIAEPAIVKQTKNGQSFSVVKLRTEAKMRDGMKESIWEVSLFGGMGKVVAECNIGDGLTCIGTMEMQEFEYNGKKYTKPRINLSHLGVSVKSAESTRTETAPTQRGTSRTITSFDPRPLPPFAPGPSPSAPSRSNGYSDEDFNDIPF